MIAPASASRRYIRAMIMRPLPPQATKEHNANSVWVPGIAVFYACMVVIWLITLFTCGW